MKTKQATDPVFLADVAQEMGYTNGYTLWRALDCAGIATFLARKPRLKEARAVEPGDLARFRAANDSIVRVSPQARRASANG